MSFGTQDYTPGLLPGDSAAIEEAATLSAIFQENASLAIKRLGLTLAFNKAQTPEEERNIVTQAMHIFEMRRHAEGLSQEALDKVLGSMALRHLDAVNSFTAAALRLLPAQSLQRELPIGLKHADTATLLRKYKLHSLATLIEAGL